MFAFLFKNHDLFQYLQPLLLYIGATSRLISLLQLMNRLNISSRDALSGSDPLRKFGIAVTHFKIVSNDLFYKYICKLYFNHLFFELVLITIFLNIYQNIAIAPV